MGAGQSISDAQWEVVTILNQVLCAVSGAASIFIIITYISLKSLQSQLSFKLILMVAISDLLSSAWAIFGDPTDEPDSFQCYAQAMLSQFGCISSALWVCAISYFIDRLMNSPKMPTRQELKKLLIFFHVFAWGGAGLTTFVPLFMGIYGDAGGWCWFNDANRWAVWALFYDIIWASVLYITFVYVRAAIYIQKLRKQSPEQDLRRVSEDQTDLDGARGLSVGSIRDASLPQPSTPTAVNSTSFEQPSGAAQKEKLKKRKRALRRMILFPAILAIGWLPSTMRRGWELVTDVQEPYFLVVLQLVFFSLIPFANALVYGLTRAVRVEIQKKFSSMCCMGKSTSENTE